MPMFFVVRAADNRRAKLKRYGLIADRLFIPKIINASGKSFIAVNANMFGGLGVTIAPHQNLAIGQFRITMMTI
jgi:hypothetical protein